MAWRLRKHILLFHLDERADWPTQHVDHSQRDVRRLRSEQTREHIVEQFSSLDQLANGVRRALRGFHSVATTPVPGLLPYVVDRHAHRERLATAAIRHELERSPSLVVVHGIVGQAHHKFVPRTDGEHRALSRQLHDFGSVTLLRFPVEVELRRGRPEVQPIARLVDYFARWPERRPLRVLPVISAQYRESSSWTSRLLWGSSTTDRVACPWRSWPRSSGCCWRTGPTS